MRQEMLDEQRSLGPLICIRETANQSVVVSASIENQALPNFVGAGVVLVNIG
jgi:hypothetical protein